MHFILITTCQPLKVSDHKRKRETPKKRRFVCIWTHNPSLQAVFFERVILFGSIIFSIITYVCMAADNQEFEYARVQFWMQGFSLRLTAFFRNNTKETHGREIIIIIANRYSTAINSYKNKMQSITLVINCNSLLTAFKYFLFRVSPRSLPISKTGWGPYHSHHLWSHTKHPIAP